MKQPQPLSLLCSRKEAASLLSISVRQMDYLIELRYFRVSRIGGRVLIQRKQIERFAQGDRPRLEVQERGSTPRGWVRDWTAEQPSSDVEINLPKCLRQAAGKPAPAVLKPLVALSDVTQMQAQPRPGRPGKYTTEEELQARRRENQQAYRMRVRSQVKALFPRCVLCKAPASCIHWIGEAGEGSKKAQIEKWARILREPEYAANFAGFCELHKPESYFTRASRGEVPKPISWEGSRAELHSKQIGSDVGGGSN